MKAAVGEFSVAALLIVIGTILATVANAVGGGLLSIGGGAGLAYLGHKRGLADVSTERRRLEQAHQERLAELASGDRHAEMVHEERVAELAARVRLADERDRQLELPQLAAEVRASGRATVHWRTRRGERRTASPVPDGVDPLEYLVYRHTRSAETPPNDPALPPIRHFVDLGDAALIPEDRAVMVGLLCDHIRESFEDHDSYTGVLIPKEGNVALGLGVAEALGLSPVLVRQHALFERTTQSVLTAGLLILVDDIWSDGTVLRRAVELARFDNFSISDGVLLFARSEGAAIDQLAQSNLTLRPRAVLSDEDIDAIIARVSSAIASQQMTQAGAPKALGWTPPATRLSVAADPETNR